MQRFDNAIRKGHVWGGSEVPASLTVHKNSMNVIHGRDEQGWKCIRFVYEVMRGLARLLPDASRMHCFIFQMFFFFWFNCEQRQTLGAYVQTFSEQAVGTICGTFWINHSFFFYCDYHRISVRSALWVRRRSLQGFTTRLTNVFIHQAARGSDLPLPSCHRTRQTSSVSLCTRLALAAFSCYFLLNYRVWNENSRLIWMSRTRGKIDNTGHLHSCYVSIHSGFRSSSVSTPPLWTIMWVGA